MEVSLPDSVAQAKAQFAAFLEKDSTWAEKKLFKFKVSISPHKGNSGGIGMDTTRLYKELRPEQQYGHNIKMMPMQPSTSSRYYSDVNRHQRQQDVVVDAVSGITERRWRADINNGIIVLSINTNPIKVLQKKKAELISDLNILLKVVSSPPKVELPE
jgi:hypothetical protein